MRLLRHISFAAIVPTLALLLAAAFAPAGPPSASAASDSPSAVEVCESEPAGWLDRIVETTRAFLS